MNTKKYDLIIWGATSFVGKITTKYIFKRYGINKELRWAIGGRDKSKLGALQTELGAEASNLAVFIGDSNDTNFLRNMVNNTRVVISTVGPYMKYGQQLVATCVQLGTDYCDLTGEAYFVRKMQDLYADKAKQSGSRIINCCGVDSIPSDLGAQFIHQAAIEKFNEPVQAVRCYIKAFKGGISGGTIASMLHMIDAEKSDPELKKIFNNPYALCPPDHRSGKKQPKIYTYFYDASIDKWVAPFVMASINTKVVHATNAQLSYPYTKNFTYAEYVVCKGQINALSKYYSVGLGIKALTLQPLRLLFEKYILPKPGEGPSLKQQQEGYFVYHVKGTTINNKNIHIEITGDQDPGYGASAKMLAEAGICLALDITKDNIAGGFWTPANAMGNKLRSRLIENAGMTFKVLE